MGLLLDEHKELSYRERWGLVAAVHAAFFHLLHRWLGLRVYPKRSIVSPTDVLADVLWTSSPDADENLLREGIAPFKVVRVGNIMIDSLEMLRNKIEALAIYDELGLARSEYGVVTLHRPSNVDDPTALSRHARGTTRPAFRLAEVAREDRVVPQASAGERAWCAPLLAQAEDSGSSCHPTVACGRQEGPLSRQSPLDITRFRTS